MNKITTIVIGLILVGVSFYGGMKYDQSKTISAQQGRATQFGGGNGRGFGGRGGAGGGFATGQIISKDAQSITIQLMGTSTTAQGSEIILLSSGTTIMKTTNGTVSDLITGQNVVVTGTKNSDGSITATSIQLRPARTIQ